MLIDFQNKIGTNTCFRVDWIVHLAKVSMDDELVPNKNQRHNISKEFQTYTIWDISHPPKKSICQEDNCHPNFFFFFWRTFLGFFDLQLMEDIKDGKEEVLDEVVMEHIK